MNINDQNLIKIVMQCKSIREVIRELGYTYTGSRYNFVKRAIQRLKIDITHFVFKPPTYTNQQLATAISSSKTLTETIHKLGLVYGGATRKNVCQRIQRLKLDTSHFILHYRKSIPLEMLMVKESQVKNSVNFKNRLIAAGILKASCQQCGITHWLGQPAPLELHHENGNHYDNRLKNLKLLCANCHRLTPNWGGKKKGYSL